MQYQGLGYPKFTVHPQIYDMITLYFIDLKTECDSIQQYLLGQGLSM